MPQTPSHHALILTGSRSLNKRQSLFIEGLREIGLGSSIRAMPRDKWSLRRFERMGEAVTTGRLSATIPADLSASTLAAVFCFHWLTLPAAVAVGRWKGIPVIYDEHDHYEMNTQQGDGTAFQKRMRAICVRTVHRMFLPFVSLVTCIHMADSLLQKHLQQWADAVIPLHNYPIAEWRRAPRRQDADDEQPLALLYVGGVFREKGCEFVANAFRALPGELRERAELHLFGGGDADLLEELSQYAGIRIHGDSTPQQIREFAMNRLCCGLTLYRDEPRYQLVGTNSRKMWEYLAMGIPLIASDVGEIPQYIKANDVGWVVSARFNHDELVNTLTEMIERPDRIRQQAANATALMHQSQMTWEHEWQKVLSFPALKRLQRENDRKAA